MIFKNLLKLGDLEKKTNSLILEYLEFLEKGAHCLRKGITKKISFLSKECLFSIERAADSKKKEIIETMYQGAFLPYVRTTICSFIECTEKVFDLFKIIHFESQYLLTHYPEFLNTHQERILRIIKINEDASILLKTAFLTLVKNKQNLQKSLVGIKLCEKYVDEIKEHLLDEIRKEMVPNFWIGSSIENLIYSLVSITDIIEDASDYLYILELSLK